MQNFYTKSKNIKFILDNFFKALLSLLINQVVKILSSKKKYKNKKSNKSS